MALPAESPSPDHRPTKALVQELFNEARKAKKGYLPKWNRYWRMVRNRSWSEFRESWLPAPSASEIFPTIATLVSWMTDQRPRSFVSASPDTLEFVKPPDGELVKQLTSDMQQVLDSWWINQDLGAQVQMALYDTFTFGCGILKTGWDPTLKFGQGDVVARRIDPYACLPDPAGSSMDDIRYFLEVRKVPKYELYQRFGSRADRVEGTGSEDEADERPQMGTGGSDVIANLRSTGVTGVFPGTATSGVAARFGRAGERAEDYTETVLLKECWVKNTRVETIPVLENGKISEKRWEIPYWEYLAESDGVILNEDTTNPFEHGQLPYVRIPMVEVGDFWSVPLVEHLIQAQVALNRLLAALQLNAEITGNPIFLFPKGSEMERTKVVNRPGTKLPHEPGAEPSWLTPPQMPQVMYELIGFWRDQIDRASGISAVARGASLRRREPASAVDSVQEASFVRIRAVLRNLEEALRRASTQTASNVVQFYLEPRTVPKVGPSGNAGYLQLGSRHFWYPDLTPDGINLIPLHFDAWMEAGSTQPLSRAARAAELMSLHFAGLVPPEVVLEAFDIPDREKVVAWANQQAAAAAAAGVKQGQNPRRR